MGQLTQSVGSAGLRELGLYTALAVPAQRISRVERRSRAQHRVGRGHHIEPREMDLGVVLQHQRKEVLEPQRQFAVLHAFAYPFDLMHPHDRPAIALSQIGGKRQSALPPSVSNSRLKKSRNDLLITKRLDRIHPRRLHRRIDPEDDAHRRGNAECYQHRRHRHDRLPLRSAGDQP